MVKLILGRDQVTLLDDSGYYRTEAAPRISLPGELTGDETIQRWLQRHPLLFAENNRTVLNPNSERDPLYIVPMVADSQIAYAACYNGEESKMVVGVGLCATAQEVEHRWTAFNRPEGIFLSSSRSAMILESRLVPSRSEEVALPLPPCPHLVAIKQPYSTNSTYIHCHQLDGWQMGKLPHEKSWILAFDGRQVIAGLSSKDVGVLARDLTTTNAPQDDEARIALVLNTLRESAGLPELPPIQKEVDPPPKHRPGVCRLLVYTQKDKEQERGFSR